jgi:hypothetical protein
MKPLAVVLALLGALYGASMILVSRAHEQSVTQQRGSQRAGGCASPGVDSACLTGPPAATTEVPSAGSEFSIPSAQPVPPPSPLSSLVVPAAVAGGPATTATNASTVVALASPSASTAPSNAVQPDGIPAAQVGPLVLNDSAAELWHTWSNTALAGASCTKPGTFTLSSASLQLTTDGTLGNCALVMSKTMYQYGIYEARIWSQAGPNGTIANWPGFWMVGPHWPAGGEIDAFEALAGYDTASFHYGAKNTRIFKRDTALKPGWVTVDVVWKPRMVAIYYNGRKFVEWDSAVITSLPMWILFDTTTGPYGYTTGQPSTMQVAYLRIWTVN